MSQYARTPQRYGGIGFAVALAAAAFSLGCGVGENSVPSAQLSGQVTLDQNPVEIGTITFIPLDGATPTAGAMIQNGTYVATVPKGECRIEISAPQKAGTRKMYRTADSPEIDLTVERIPAAYNVKSKLTHSVSEDQRDLDFNLLSKP